MADTHMYQFSVCVFCLIIYVIGGPVIYISKAAGGSITISPGMQFGRTYIRFVFFLYMHATISTATIM